MWTFGAQRWRWLDAFALAVARQRTSIDKVEIGAFTVSGKCFALLLDIFFVLLVGFFVRSGALIRSKQTKRFV